MKLATSLLLVLVIGSSSAQDALVLKKKQVKDGVFEYFFVLKENKELKNGEYVRGYKDLLERPYLMEVGQYKGDLKSGQWLTFHQDNLNSLKSSGGYMENKKEGPWRYFFPSPPVQHKLVSPLMFEKRTYLVDPQKADKAFVMEIDSSGQQIQSRGNYHEDIKTGIWEYFSGSGELLQRFDHSANRMVENNLQERPDGITFLGGQQRFTSLFNSARQELSRNRMWEKSSQAVYEVGADGRYIFVKGYGENSFKIHIDEVLQQIPSEWVNLDPDAEKKLAIIASEVIDQQSRRIKSSMEIKVLE